MTVIAHAARSGIAALDVVTAALDADRRTQGTEVMFAKTPAELVRAIAGGPCVVAHSFYSPDARAAAEVLSQLLIRAPHALHVAGGVHVAAGRGNIAAMPPKTACPVSLTQFMEKAEPMKVSINGQEMLAEVKQFSTGSFGWYMNGKTVVSIDGKAVSVQIGMNLTVVGSKDAER